MMRRPPKRPRASASAIADTEMTDRNSGRAAPESVYFYTFHKCGSSLFSGYVLKNVEGLRHIDYAGMIYRGERVEKVEFADTGHVYGPIRLSADPVSPVYSAVVRPLSDEDFIRDRIALFMIRDPRDILVSAYFSFGFSHGFSPVARIREREESFRNEIQGKTIDQYALDTADRIAGNFATLKRLRQACPRATVLRYEDMIEKFDEFIGSFTRYLKLSDAVIDEMYRRSRPQPAESVAAHRRSGKVAGFRSKLRPETIDILTEKFRPIFLDFSYEE
jgi:hypothetical protein